MEQNSEKPNVKECRETKGWLKYLLIAVGTLSVALGFLGIFLPLLPTTPFLLLAAACYIRSSQRFYCWLINNRYFGKYIRDYREKGGIPLKLKVYVISLMWVVMAATAIFVIDLLVVRILLVVIAGGVTIHLLSLKTIRE
jgi:uncharacterized membrane protein YbaN (DUF454 family)